MRKEARSSHRQFGSTHRPVSWKKEPLPGGPYTVLQLLVFPISFALTVTLWVSVVYLLLFAYAYAAVAILPDDFFAQVAPLLGQSGNFSDDAMLQQFHEPFIHNAPVWPHDRFSWLTAPVTIPTTGPVAAAVSGVSAFGLRKGLRILTAPPRPKPVPVRLRGVLPPDGRVAASTGASGVGDLASARERRELRIAGVRAALEQLDAEWLSYEMDLEAYYLAKPLLRDGDVAQTAAYQSALYELRDLAEALGEDSSLSEIAAAERAADAALMAWGAANDHALGIGVSDRSPTERAALRRLHALTAQLADPSTPDAMCSGLIEAISREMGKLRTVTATWEHLSRVPALEHRNLAAIEAGG